MYNRLKNLNVSLQSLISEFDFGSRLFLGFYSTFSPFLLPHCDNVGFVPGRGRARTKTEKKTTIEIEFRNPKGTRFPQSGIVSENFTWNFFFYSTRNCSFFVGGTR
jgi:hypothetical protein